ncbi:hypothetical protein WJX73_005436 [Symbiochloris irregularis]|uniref:Reverse transcriptase n=1 Tax=Symbiochloris irregularis TaxID=706552 RepID=A0AAW1NWC5_9CHLO
MSGTSGTPFLDGGEQEAAEMRAAQEMAGGEGAGNLPPPQEQPSTSTPYLDAARGYTGESGDDIPTTTRVLEIVTGVVNDAIARLFAHGNIPESGEREQLRQGINAVGGAAVDAGTTAQAAGQTAQAAGQAATHAQGMAQQAAGIATQAAQTAARTAATGGVQLGTASPPPSNIKPPPPPRYKGAGTEPRILEWCHKAEQFLRASGHLDTEMGVFHVASYLDGEAATWWRLQTAKMNDGTATRITKWADLEPELKRRFAEVNRQTAVRDQFSAIRQTTSVTDYINRFRAIVVELPEVDEGMRVYQFLKGLKPNIQANTRTHKPATLEIAMDIADEADKAVYQAHSGGFRAGTSNNYQPRAQTDTHTNTNRPNAIRRPGWGNGCQEGKPTCGDSDPAEETFPDVTGQHRDRQDVSSDRRPVQMAAISRMYERKTPKRRGRPPKARKQRKEEIAQPTPRIESDRTRAAEEARQQSAPGPRDPEDWMYQRERFLELDNEFGPFSLDAAANPNGDNAQCKAFCSKEDSFLGKELRGETIWANFPYARADEFLTHYLGEKAKDPTLAGMFVLPKWTGTTWWSKVQHMQQVRQHAAGERIFTAPPQGARNKERRNLGPTPWPVCVFWDPPRENGPPPKAKLDEDPRVETDPLRDEDPQPDNPEPPTQPTASEQHTHHEDERPYAAMGRKLLIVDGRVDKHPAKILIDGGAQADLISRQFVEKYRISARLDHSIGSVEMAGGQVQDASVMTQPTVQMEQWSASVDLHATEIPGYDVILGKPWLTAWNPTVNWRTNELNVEDGERSVRIKARAQPARRTHRSTPSIQLISQVKFRRLQRRSRGDVFVGMVTEVAPPSASGDCKANTAPQASHGAARTADLLSVGDQAGTQVEEGAAKTAKTPLAARIEKLADEFPDVFEEPTGLPPERDIEHTIDLEPGSRPSCQPSRRLSPQENEEAIKQITGFLEKAHVRPSSSPFAAPILFASKKDGGLRMCIDYRALNKMTVKDKYPMPRADDLFDELLHARVFTKLDLRSGYHQIRMREEDIQKTAFRTRFGHYEFTVMPFGLTNAPATFQRMMNNVLSDFLGKFVVVYRDDILIFSRSEEEHKDHVRRVMQRLREHNLKCGRSKCAFGLTEVEYLGHIVTDRGVKMDQKKVDAVKQWPIPRTKPELRSFLGLAGYYRKFIKHYAQRVHPMSELLKDAVEFTWGEPQQKAFEDLQTAMTSAPVLAIPDPSLPYEVYTDSSAFGVVRWVEFLQAYDCKVDYVPGERNMADALSRRPDMQEATTESNDQLRSDPAQSGGAPGTARAHGAIQGVKPSQGASGATSEGDSVINLMHISVLEPDSSFLDLVKQASVADAYPSRDRMLTSRNGLYYLGTRLYVPPSLRRHVVEELHSSAYGGHFGTDKTIDAITRRFFWPHIKRTVRKFVRECLACQRSKPRSGKAFGLLQPIPIPDRPWEQVTLDLVTDLPTTPTGHDAILVVVDRLSKMVHFVPTTKTVTAEGTARLFKDHVFKYHGLPEVIIGDRDVRWSGQFWSAVFRSLGTKIRLSTAYHPQTDGQTERANRTMEEILRSYVHPLADDWEARLGDAEFSYNNSTQASTGRSPFYTAYGFHPRMVGPNAATLELPPKVRVHPTVNVSRLKAYHGRLGPNGRPVELRQRTVAEHIIIEDDEHAREPLGEIEHIKACRPVFQTRSRNKLLRREFLVSFKGSEAQDDSWIGEAALQEAGKLATAARLLARGAIPIVQEAYRRR